MFKWNNIKKEGFSKMTRVEIKTDTAVDERLAALSKRILEAEDRLTEIEFSHKEEIENAASVVKQIQEKLALLEAQADRLGGLATSTSNNAASKDELLGLVNSLASALKSTQDRMDLPF